MRCGHSPGGLIVAGGIVSLIGIAIIMARAMQAPTYWIPLLVGAVLLGAGVVRRAQRNQS